MAIDTQAKRQLVLRGYSEILADPVGGGLVIPIAMYHRKLHERQTVTILKQSTAVDVLIGPFVDDTDGNSEEASLTIAAADVLLSKNGQTMALKSDVTACLTDAKGMYNCELDATDTNTVGTLVLFVHVAGALAVRHEFQVIEEVVYVDMFATSGAGYAGITELGTAQTDLDTITGSDGVTLATAQGLYAPNVVVPDAAGVAPTAIENRTEMDSNSTVLATIATDTTTDIPALINGLNDVAATDIVSAGAITTLTGAVVNVDLVDTLTTYTSNTLQTGDSFARLGAPAAASVSADILAVDNFVDGLETTIGVAGAGLTDITLNAASVDLILDETLTAHVTADSFGVAVKDILADTADIQPNYATSASITALNDVAATDIVSAGAITTLTGAVVNVDLVDTITTYTGNTLQTGDVITAINDLANGTDGLTALKAVLDTVATDTTTDIPALINGLDDVTAAQVLTQVNTALDTVIAELGVGAPVASPSIRNAVMLMYMALRNKTIVQTSGTDALEIHNDAGTKIAAKLLTDDGSDYTEAEMA